MPRRPFSSPGPEAFPPAEGGGDRELLVGVDPHRSHLQRPRHAPDAPVVRPTRCRRRGRRRCRSPGRSDPPRRGRAAPASSRAEHLRLAEAGGIGQPGEDGRQVIGAARIGLALRRPPAGEKRRPLGQRLGHMRPPPHRDAPGGSAAPPGWPDPRGGRRAGPSCGRPSARRRRRTPLPARTGAIRRCRIGRWRRRCRTARRRSPAPCRHRRRR